MTMPPGDTTTYERRFADFGHLRDAVEATWEELNHIVEWTFYDREMLDPEGDETQRFALYIVMPRKEYRSTEYRTSVFDRAEVDRWIAEYARPRALRWYDPEGTP